MKRRCKWPLPQQIEASPLVQRADVLQHWARTSQGRDEMRTYLAHFRKARDIYKHNARACQAAVEAIEAVLGELEA